MEPQHGSLCHPVHEQEHRCTCCVRIVGVPHQLQAATSVPDSGMRDTRGDALFARQYCFMSEAVLGSLLYYATDKCVHVTRTDANTRVLTQSMEIRDFWVGDYFREPSVHDRLPLDVPLCPTPTSTQ